MKNSAFLRVGILAIVIVAVAAFAASAVAAGTAKLVSTARNPTLHKTILVTRTGLTLYSLSVERHGKFVCKTSSCTSLWHPLTVAKGKKPAGVAGLGTVKRPGGKTQVTYHGAPLYTFYLDHKRGDIMGNGFRDVGVWRAVALAK